MSNFRIEMLEHDFFARGGAFDSILESTFDAALLVNKDGIILHQSNGSLILRDFTKEEVTGKHFSEINPKSLFSEVLKTGRSLLGAVDVIENRKCIVNLYPIYCGGRLTGALATVIFSNLSTLKEIIARIRDIEPDEVGDLYNIMARIGTSITFRDYVGESVPVRNLITQCRRAAASNRPILLIGETGTGKEILASAIHSESMEGSWRPFIKLNCSAIPKELLESELFGHEKGAFTGAAATKKGKFELASGGSILLDEIGDMDIGMQSKLLRVLEEKEFERVGGIRMIPMTSRVIASTNADLRDKCHQSTFRSDLYYRLSAIEIKVPPLRERKDDIPLLIRNFIKRDQLDFELEPDAIKVFFEYDWPGNVRELRNIVNRIGIFISEGTVTSRDVRSFMEGYLEYDEQSTPGDKQQGTVKTEYDSFAVLEKQWLIQALQSCDYNVSDAAKRLGVSRATVYNRMKKYGVN